MPKGRILDCGYGDIMVHPDTAVELMSGGMTHVNGNPVRLETVSEYPDVEMVILRVWPTNGAELVGYGRWAG